MPRKAELLWASLRRSGRSHEGLMDFSENRKRLAGGGVLAQGRVGGQIDSVPVRLGHESQGAGRRNISVTQL